jgi:methionyl-tRNA formyltransferase
MPNFVFLGTGGLLSSICLKALIANNMYPKQVILYEESVRLYPNLTEIIASNAKIPSVNIQNINTQENVAFLKSLSVDFGIVASYGQIFKNEIISLFPIFNVHMGVLPDYRGAYTNFWKILDDHNIFGVTIHLINEKIDSGEAVLIVEKDFEGIIFANDFFRKNYEMAAEGIIQVIHQHLTRNLNYVPLDEAKGHYYRKHTNQDMILNPNEDVNLLHTKINRLQFYGRPSVAGFSIAESNLMLYANVKQNEFSIQEVSENLLILKNSTGILLLKHYL